MFQVEERSHHLELTFHDPESANALSLDAALELHKICLKHRFWTKPVLVYSAHPRQFCSGGNLRDHLRYRTRAAGLRDARRITRALDAFAVWKAPKLAVVEGECLGGGLEWLARFDARWATPASAFGFWQARLALSFGWGGGSAWAKILGEERTRALLMHPRLLDAYSARRLGLIDRVSSSDVVRTEAARWAAEQALAAGEWSVRRERSLFARRWWSTPHRQALARFRGTSPK